MIETFKLPNGVFPTKEALMNYKIAQAFSTNIKMGQGFQLGFKPNPNQQRVMQVISTSTVPEGEWLHILLWGVPRSGKTWAALYYLMDTMLKFPGVRSLGVRATTSELNASVFLDIDKLSTRYQIPIVRRSTQEGLIELGNGSQFWFKSDKSLTPGATENTARKMGGMEYSLAMVEEADTVSSETSRAIPHRLSQTGLGKFRKVIFYTQNPPDTSHWTYEFFYKDPLHDPDDPASPKRAIHCTLDGNAENIDPAYRTALEKEYKDDPAMDKRFAQGLWAPTTKGDPIFRQSFRRDWHVAKDPFWKNWDRSQPIYRGWDFGFRGNALVIAQDDLERRQLRVFMAILERKILFEQFLDIVLTRMYRDFPGAEWRDFPDPNGDQKTGLNEHSYHDIMRSRGLNPVYDKRKKSIVAGVNAISRELRATGKAGQPAVLFDPGAITIIDAFESGYCNKKGTQKDEINPAEDSTYIHTMDAFRYLLISNRDLPMPGEASRQDHSFPIMEQSRKAKAHNAMEELKYMGPSRGGGARDGGFSRSRFL